MAIGLVCCLERVKEKREKSVYYYYYYYYYYWLISWNYDHSLFGSHWRCNIGRPHKCGKPSHLAFSAQ